MIEWDIRCDQCGRRLDEPPELSAEQRQPCPVCGSLGRQRNVVMIPGEVASAPGNADALWLQQGAALARAASALEEALRGEDLTPKQRAHAERAWLDVLKALDEYRRAAQELHRG